MAYIVNLTTSVKELLTFKVWQFSTPFTNSWNEATAENQKIGNVSYSFYVVCYAIHDTHKTTMYTNGI